MFRSKWIIAIALVVATAFAAMAQNRILILIAPLPATTGKVLLVDGVSHLLQVDGTSKVCKAPGC